MRKAPLARNPRWPGCAWAIALSLGPGRALAEESPLNEPAGSPVSQPEQVETVDSARFGAFVDEGVRRFGDGDFRGAAQALQKAYAERPVTRLLYNIARAFDRAGDSAEAVKFYAAYLKAKGPEAELLVRAEEALRRLAPAPRKVPIAPARPASERPPLAPPQETSKLFSATNVGIATLGLGAGVLIASAMGDGWILNEDADRFQEARRAGDPDAVRFKESFEATRRWVSVGYVGGGLLLAAGAGLVAVGALSRPPASLRASAFDEPSSVGFWLGPSTSGAEFRTRW